MRTRLFVTIAWAVFASCLAVPAQGAPTTLWPSTAVPAVVDVGPDSSVELGVTFRSSVGGTITGIRFYKGPANTGTHVGSLWTSTGVLLARATFAAETASGWQQVNFSSPVSIAANTLYVASYHTNGHFSVSNDYFAASGRASGSLTAPANAGGNRNGVFKYGTAIAFPQSTYRSSNYWVDVVFNPSAAPASLKVTTTSLPNGTRSVAYSATLAATGGTTPLTWSVLSGTLPNGLTLSSSGTVAGTPTTAGAFTFTVQVRDASGASASSTFSLNIVTPAAPTVAITSPASGASVSGIINLTGTSSSVLGVNSVQIAVDGGAYSNAAGTANWTFALDTGALANGSHSLTARATDTAGTTSTSPATGIVINNSGLATNCTLFASTSGNDSNSGSSPSAPKSFQGAANAAQPGAVVCVMGGTYNRTGSFYPPRSGTANAWIVYKAYGDGPVNFVYTGTSANWTAMFHTGNNAFPNGPSYLEFNGFTLDGQNQAVDGVYCNGSHHLRILNNTIKNFGAAGIASVRCDYMEIQSNRIHHVGYGEGWSSGISLNTNQWFDGYAGFHNIVANNIISGSYDASTYHTDGNGIILDLGGTTPAVLIINNVVYGNGGRCIQALSNTSFWVVNNTCYKNGLDTSSAFGSFVTQNASNGYFINNIGVGWNGRKVYEQQGTAGNIQYFADMYFGGANSFSNSQLIQADPLFVAPPVFDPLLGGQYATALAPWLLGSGLQVLPSSPARGRGIDPSTLPGLPSAIVTDLRKYIYKDINGNPRSQTGAFDLGAYQQ